MRRTKLLLALMAAAVSPALILEGEAKACGGCFHEPGENDSIITDHRMILSVSQTQTTLYDQIEYQGSPSSFAWVLPIRGTVDVGLSADILFASLHTLTQTTVVAPAPNCPPPPTCGNVAYAGAAEDAGAVYDGQGGGVTVVTQQVVGPYATVQLAATDPNALTNWLTQNNYNVPSSAEPILAQYIQQGFGFLALKLVPGAGVQAMLPVRVTSQGASPVLPLRMVAIGTGVTVGITLWVISDGRSEPQNFPWFHIDDSQLVWDWSTNSSNYKTLRAQDEAQYNGAGWEIESSLSLAEQTLTSLVESSVASSDYQPSTLADGGMESADQVRMDDLDTVFAGMAGPNVRVTRIRSDLAHTALGQDLTLQASSDQSILSNVRNVTQTVNAPQCPIYGSDCSIIGYGPNGSPTGGGLGASGGGSSFSCATSSKHPSEPSVDATFFVGAVMGFFGLAAMRGRRRRGD